MRCEYYRQCQYATPFSLSCRITSIFCPDRNHYELQDKEDKRIKEMEAERLRRLGGYYKK